MGLKGNLSTVNLAEVFQVLSRGNSSGLLRIQAPEGPRFVEILDGAISVAGRSAERIMLGDLLLSRGLIDEPKLEEALQAQKDSGKLIGEVLLSMGVVTMEQLEEALRFQIEEEVCELFFLKSGEFDFVANATLDAKIAPAGGLVRLKIDANALLIEAARRADEWKVLQERLPSQSLLFKLTKTGEETLNSGEGISTEGAILLKLVQSRRTIESMVQKGCLGRLTTNQMLIELWDAGFVELLPLTSYEKAAREHLRERRYEEAMRIANLLLDHATEEKKDDNIAAAQALLQEVDKAKKLAAQASSVKVSADPKVRSEVIRRAQAGVILKKERSYTPVIIAAVVLIGALGGYIAFAGKGGGRNDDPEARRNLESAIAQSQEKMVAEDYTAALRVLQEFKTSNPEIQKQASEAYDKQVHFVETQIMKAMETFEQAYTENKTAELAAAAEKLEKVMEIGVTNPDLQVQRKEVGDKLSKYRSTQKSGKYQTRLADILKNARGKGPDETEQALKTLMGENAPEEVAGPARDELGKIQRAGLEARRVLALADRIRAEGHVDAARLEYEQVKELAPGSKIAQDADKGLNALNDLQEKTKAQLAAAEALITQKKTTEAKAELLKMLQQPLPLQIHVRALDLYQSLVPEDPAVEKAIADATANWDRQPGEARSAILQAVEKTPFSKAAVRAVLKTSITSVPEGAEILVDGQPSGKTPGVVGLPAAGRYALSIKKEGFHTLTLYQNNFREESIAVRLNRVASGAARMPSPARSALIADPGIETDRLLLLAGGELTVASRPELKVQKRVKLPGLEAAIAPGVPALSTDRLQAVVSAADKALFFVPLTGAAPSRWPLDEQPLSTPILFSSDQVLDTLLAAVATQSGLEIWNVNTGALHKRIGGGKQEEPGFVCALHDTVVMARRDNLVAFAASSGERLWLAELAKVCGMAQLDKNIIAVNTDGKLSLVAIDKGTVKREHDLKGKPIFGVIAAGAEALITLKGGRLEVHGVEQDAPRWTAKLSGEISVQPAVYAGPGRKVVAACTIEENEHYVNVLSFDNGQVLYRGLLPARAVAAAVDGKRVYVSTDDGDVTVFE